tara:strand:+ start:5382 stop:6437 length:1056 start_codon:yes stop_codon:yes gene_type:complete
MISEKIYKSFNRKNVLVTGGTGMIGRKVCDLLVKNTTAYVVSVSMDRLELNEKVHYRYGDLSDFNGFYELLKENNIHAVFHCAGVKGSPKMTKEKPASFFVPLMQMNTNVLEACRLNKIEHVVYTSSIGAYSNVKIIDQLEGYDLYVPKEVFRESEDTWLDPMDSAPGWAKRMGEKQIECYARQYSLNYGIVRLGNVYGEGDNFDPENAMVIPSLIEKIRQVATLTENKKFGVVQVLGDGSAIRDFCYSEDIAKGIILAMYYGTGGKFYNLGAGRGFSIKEVLENLKDIIQFEYNFSEEKSEYSKRVLDTGLAKERLGFEPEITLREGLERTWKWYLENTDETFKRKNYFI